MRVRPAKVGVGECRRSAAFGAVVAFYVVDATIAGAVIGLVGQGHGGGEAGYKVAKKRLEEIWRGDDEYAAAFAHDAGRKAVRRAPRGHALPVIRVRPHDLRVGS